MKVLTPGHKYEVANFENKEAQGQTIQFIEKVLDNQSEIPGTLRTLNDGTTNEELIEVLIDRISYLQAKFPCKENACAITKLQEANFWLRERTRLRVAQNVEGKNLEHK